MGYTKGLLSVITRDGEPLVKKMAAVSVFGFSNRDLSRDYFCRNLHGGRLNHNNPNDLLCVSRIPVKAIGKISFDVLSSFVYVLAYSFLYSLSFNY
ncbi:unnamed protein product [Lactuca virosa]|uniref:Uncharacterized protein n=1 Tax=Lactuca virosa TaxID=75947 RepID=A0AAU9P8S6_9ASTR|nr:unnamed protein product [Lactuca virosa]